MTVFGLGLGTAAAAAALLTVLGPFAGPIAVMVLLVAALHPRSVGGKLARPFLAGAMSQPANAIPAPPRIS